MVFHWRSASKACKNAWAGASEFLVIARPIFAPFIAPLRVVLALLALSVLLESMYPLLYGRLTDALVSRNVRLAIITIGVLLLQSAIRVVVEYARDYYEDEHITWALNLHIMTNSLERISGLSMTQFLSSHTGKTRDIVRNGRNALHELLRLVIYNVGPTLLRLLFALIAITIVSRTVGMVAIVGTLTYLGVAFSIFVKHRKPIRELEDRDNENSKMFADALANMEIVKAYAREQKIVDDFRSDGQQMAEQNLMFVRGARKWHICRISVALACRNILIAVTAFLLFNDAFTFGVFMSLTQWAMQTIGAMQDLGQLQKQVSRHMANIELYLHLLQQPPDLVVGDDATSPTSIRGAIEFNDVTYEYKPRPTQDPLEVSKPTTALRNVSFSIPPGQKVALVGESGAGKSTIAYLLIRAGDPKDGYVSIDGNDVRDLELSALRRRIGYVPQQPKLFDRTLRYNLTFGLENSETVPDERLSEALALVKLEHLAEANGLDCRLGEGGHSLSGGERQRLCIARALIKDPDVLIFDEATSSLDPVNEKKVQDAIDTSRGRTKIIIAHRYSTIRDADRILVFEAGQLVDDGPHDSLLQRCTYYRGLLEQQRLL